MNLPDIDPAFSLIGEFAKHTKGTAAHIQKMRESAIYADGVFPGKVKVLAAMLWSIAARCEPCVKFYVGKARELGATEQELSEFLAVASTMGGCVGEMWALKAYAAHHGTSVGEESCCASES